MWKPVKYEEKDLNIAINRGCREMMKVKLLNDIYKDMVVCDLEGWDKLEYLDELIELLTDVRYSRGIKNVL